MENSSSLEHAAAEPAAARFNLGSFEGFNFRTQSAIEHILSASDLIAWDHDRKGEAEFWPAGDHPGVSFVFRGRTSVTGSEVRHLGRLLDELQSDDIETFLRIGHALDVGSVGLPDLTADHIEDLDCQIFVGSNFTDLRRNTAHELFELYYPEEYVVWEKSHCDGLIFDTDRFLDSPTWSVEEVKIGDKVALIVSPQ